MTRGLPPVFVSLFKIVLGSYFLYQDQAPEATGPLVPVVGRNVGSFALSPDGSQVAYVNIYFSANLNRYLCELNLVDLDTPGEPKVLNGPKSWIEAFSFVSGETHFVD